MIGGEVRVRENPDRGPLAAPSGCIAEEAPAAAVSSLRVTGERELADVIVGKLSPDGEWLLYSGSEGSCVRKLDDSAKHCFERADGIGGAKWSPDSAHVAFSEDLLVGYEPDVWVLDVESGDARNLTDDGISVDALATLDRVQQPIPDDAVVDGWPSWTADGEHLRFVRRADPETIDLMSIPAEGGDPTRLESVDGDIERLWQFVWSGDTVAWVTAANEEIDAQGVVRVANVADGEPRDLMRGDFGTLTISADGEYVMADGTAAGAPAKGEARVVPVGGGEPVAVAPGNIIAPTWSPKGHAIAYLTPPGTLQVVGGPGGVPKDLGDVRGRPGSPGDQMHWVAEVLLVNLDGESTLVGLEG